jgi:hypothetical protein
MNSLKKILENFRRHPRLVPQAASPTCGSPSSLPPKGGKGRRPPFAGVKYPHLGVLTIPSFALSIPAYGGIGTNSSGGIDIVLSPPIRGDIDYPQNRFHTKMGVFAVPAVGGIDMGILGVFLIPAFSFLRVLLLTTVGETPSVVV